MTLSVGSVQWVLSDPLTNSRLFHILSFTTRLNFPHVPSWFALEPSQPQCSLSRIGFALPPPQLPPFYRREQEIVSTAVGAATLQWIRDEQDIIATVLRDSAADEEGKRKAAVADAICNAIDQVSLHMPMSEDAEDSATAINI